MANGTDMTFGYNETTMSVVTNSAGHTLACVPETSTAKTGDDMEAWIDDATWILTSSFIIFTMQSGFGLLESGMASQKNEVNIMVKNVVDVVFGGLTYWAIGYGLTFGEDAGSNGFTGVGSFFVDPDEEHMGTVFSKFIFQASFCTTATTIVSGAIAERTKLTAYIAFCFLNTLVYSFPAHWIWAPNGWLKQMHVVDVAGVGPVHLVGGVSALVASIMIKPRHGRFEDGGRIHHGNSVNALLGLFILWWGWLGFNCGSTFGISGGKWKLAARSATTTILASCGGGSVAFLLSFLIHKGKFDIRIVVNGILGALVSITGICAVTTTWAAVLIGAIGACVTTSAEFLLIKLKIDDPVGASAVHFAGSIWGMLCCGIFAQKDNIEMSFSHHDGLVWGGGFYLLGIQTLAVMVIIIWAIVTSSLILKGIDKVIGLRLTLEEELYGADYFEHDIEPSNDVREYAERILKKREEDEANSKQNGNAEEHLGEIVDDESDEKSDDENDHIVVNGHTIEQDTLENNTDNEGQPTNGHNNGANKENSKEHTKTTGKVVLPENKETFLTRFRNKFRKAPGTNEYNVNEAYVTENNS